MKLTESERGEAFEAMRRRQVGDVPEPPAWVVGDPLDRRGDGIIIGIVVACMVAVIVAVVCGVVLYGARAVGGGW